MSILVTGLWVRKFKYTVVERSAEFQVQRFGGSLEDEAIVNKLSLLSGCLRDEC